MSFIGSSLVPAFAEYNCTGQENADTKDKNNCLGICGKRVKVSPNKESRGSAECIDHCRQNSKQYAFSIYLPAFCIDSLISVID